MTQDRTCPACGNPLSPSAPSGLCPACLLQQAGQTNTVGFTADDQPSTHWTPPQVGELSPLFPDLEILRLIGRGGMGAVYQARQKSLDRVVALKILPPEMAGDPAFAERFAREAQAMAKLNHPHIVDIYEFGQREAPGLSGDQAPAPSPLTTDHWPLTTSVYFFIMEYVDGLSLRGVLDSGRVSPKEALAIVPQICDALQYAHDQGIVHRDIKPENILLNKQGQVKIADFGLAKLMGRTPALGEKVMGTPQYMAPEQLEHPAEVDHRADIYSLGVVFYQMLTGELPIGRFALPSKTVHVDVRLDEVVLKALEREPQKRYQKASEVKTLVEAMTQAQALPPLAAIPPQSSSPLSRRDPRRRMLVALAVIAAVLVPVIIVVVLLVASYFYLGASVLLKPPPLPPQALAPQLSPTPVEAPLPPKVPVAPPVPLAGDLRQLTITQAYWADSPDAPLNARNMKSNAQSGGRAFWIVCREWLDNAGDYLQFKPFMNQVDRQFVLRANGQPDVPCELTKSFVTNGPPPHADMEIVVAPNDYAKMARGMPYTLLPLNKIEGYAWTVAEGVTLTRD